MLIRILMEDSRCHTVPERLVTNLVVRYRGEEARFLAAVEKPIAAAERGDFIEEEAMDLAAKRYSSPDAERPEAGG
jgi:hypothetical protein